MAADRRRTLPFPFPHSEDAFCVRSGSTFLHPEILAVLQYRPSQPGILGSNRHRCLPVAASLQQRARPATEAILLVSQTIEDGTRTEDQQAAQIAVAGLGDAS